MTTPWRKAMRDLLQEQTRTMLVVLAIAVGVAGFSSVLASYAILTRELNRGYLATNPASATLRTDTVDDALVDVVRTVPGVAMAEARRSLGGRIRGGTNGWRNLVLFVVKDFADIRVSKLERERGAWPPATGEILIERDAFQVARVRIGDQVLVRTNDGTERTLRVSGSVHDVGQAQARMENGVYGYISQATLAQLTGDSSFNRVLIVVNGDEARIRRVAEDVKKVIESRGHPVTRVDIPPPGKHPHAELMGLLMLLLAAFGLFVMLLSGVIVVNLLTALMAAQVRQIGVMKTLGGTRAQIARIYFSQALLLGVAAVAIALPAGVWGSRVLCRAMAVFLNFDITSFAIPAWVFALVVITGIIVPLLAAAVPVWRGSGVSIHRALTDFGVAASGFGTSGFDRMLANVGGFARPLLLAIRNNFRRRTRLALTVLTLAAGGLFFMTALNLRASMIHTLDRLFAQKKFDLSVSLNGEARSAEVLRVIRAIPGVRAAECWMYSDGTIALPPQTKMLQPQLVRGRWLRDGDTDARVINTALAAKNPRMNIVGVVREPFSPPTAYAATHGDVTNSVRIAVDGTRSMDQMKAVIEERLAHAGIKVNNVTAKDDTRFSFDQHMVMIYVALIIMSAMIGAVGGLGLSTTMSVNVLERRRELGVLRAVGATPRTIWLLLVVEACVVAVGSWMLAGLAAWPLSRGLANWLDFTFELRGLAIWLVVSLVLGALASFIPAQHSTSQPVREALGYE
jgi:putative ABC transport system permease protein